MMEVMDQRLLTVKYGELGRDEKSDFFILHCCWGLVAYEQLLEYKTGIWWIADYIIVQMNTSY